MVYGDAKLDELMGELTELQRKFVELYVSDPRRNGTRAAMGAGYTRNKAAAAVQACENLKNPKIMEAISALENQVRSADDLLPRMVAALSAIAFTDLSDVMTWDGKGRVRLVPSSKLTPEAAAAIAAIEDIQEEKQVQPRLPGLQEDEEAQAAEALNVLKRKIKMHDKLKAMELLARICVTEGYMPGL